MVPNSGNTGYEWALKISGGGSGSSTPVVDITATTAVFKQKITGVSAKPTFTDLTSVINWINANFL
jgi:hypothetical protein